MKCEEAAEFVSALCDGETIPRAAAEHIGACQLCALRLKEYLEIGTELRRVASLEPMNQVKMPFGNWPNRARSDWWWRGWEAVKIPRFVFASLLIAVVVLGSGLAMVLARAKNQGTVLMLTAKPPDGSPIHCPLSLVDEKAASCSSFAPEHSFAFRVISKDGDRIQIGVRIGPGAEALKKAGTEPLNVNGLPEKQYWLEPGKELPIAVPDAGMIVLTGELTDHVPPLAAGPEQQLDPNAGELRFVSPLLLRDKEEVQDLEGATAIASEATEAIEFFAPGDALYRVSLSPLEGAVQGSVEVGRVSFELNGHSYKFLLAAPVTRKEHVWVQRLGNYNPPSDLQKHGFLGTVNLAHLQENSPATN
jgi:hypothetical protein